MSAARFGIGDLLRFHTSDYPAGYVRSINRDAKGVWYVLGFGRGRSKQEQMGRDEALVLVRSNAETDEFCRYQRARVAQVSA